jgi:hypothetical protein
MWYRLDLPYMFLCKQCVTKFGFRESLMQSVEVEIDRATTFGQHLEDLVVQKGSVTIGQDQDRDRLLLAHWALAFDLDKSILALMRLKFYGGAFALLRPLIEAQIRAHIVLMGSSNDVSQIKDDKYNVNFSTIGAEIDKNFALHGYYEKFLNGATGALHSFTHSGLSQLGRRFKGDDLAAHYDNGEIIEVIHTATTAVFFVNILVTKHFKFENEWKRTGELFEEWGRPH